MNNIFDNITGAQSFAKHLISNFLIPFLGTIFFMLFLIFNKSVRKKVVDFFFASAICILLLIFADAGEYYYSMLPSPTFMRSLCACFGYALRVFILCFALSVLFVDDSKKYKVLIHMPAILNAIIAFLSLIPSLSKYGISYTESNGIVRGPLIIVPFAVSFFYFIVLLIVSTIRKKKASNNEILLLMFIFGISAVTTILEAFYRYKGMLTGSSMLGLIFYYVFYLIKNYSVDQLTGANVRYKLYIDVNDKKSFSIIMIDINGLKNINDTKGHLAGDKALQVLVDDIRDNIAFFDSIYRMGGDEFVVILKTTKLEDIMEIARNIKNDYENDGYSLALGYSIKENDEDFEDLLKQADKMLYDDKMFYKEQK